MPGVVRTRGEFVDDQFAVALQKHLDCEESDEIEAPGHLAGEFASRSGNPVRDARRGEGEIEDVMPMNIFANRKDRRLAVRSTRDDNRDFLLKIDHALQDALRILPRGPDRVEVRLRIDPLLSFPVVAKSRALQDRGPADSLPARSSGQPRSRRGETARPETRRRRGTLFPANDLAR